MEERKTHIYKDEKDAKLNPIEGVDRACIGIGANTISGWCSGAIMLLSADNHKYADQTQTALVQAGAMYFGKQMEEWFYPKEYFVKIIYLIPSSKNHWKFSNDFYFFIFDFYHIINYNSHACLIF